MRQFSIAQLYEDHREKLQLNWIAALGADRLVEMKETGNYGADIVGHLNLIHAERLQVIGQAENDWAQRVSPKRLTTQISELIADNPPGIIFADGLEALPVASEEECVRHVRLEQPLTLYMNALDRQGAILLNPAPHD